MASDLPRQRRWFAGKEQEKKERREQKEKKLPAAVVTGRVSLVPVSRLELQPPPPTVHPSVWREGGQAYARTHTHTHTNPIAPKR